MAKIKEKIKKLAKKEKWLRARGKIKNKKQEGDLLTLRTAPLSYEELYDDIVGYIEQNYDLTRSNAKEIVDANERKLRYEIENRRETNYARLARIAIGEKQRPTFKRGGYDDFYEQRMDNNHTI